MADRPMLIAWKRGIRKLWVGRVRNAWGLPGASRYEQLIAALKAPIHHAHGRQRR